jgi:hypothetical protein
MSNMSNMSPLANARDMSNPPNAPTRKQAFAKSFKAAPKKLRFRRARVVVQMPSAIAKQGLHDRHASF